MTGEPPVRAYLRRVDAEISRPVTPGPRGRELLDRIPQVLQDLGTVRLEEVGSACCGTSVAGFSDVDVLVVFTDPVHEWLGRWDPHPSEDGRAQGRQTGARPAADLPGLPEGMKLPPGMEGLDFPELPELPDLPGGSLPYALPEVSAALSEPGRPLPPGPVPGDVFDVFAARLAALAPAEGFGTPVPDECAVKFPVVHDSAGDEPSVELVPGLDADFLWDSPQTAPSSGLSFRVFPGTRNRWLGTHPELHDTVLTCSPGGSDYTCRELIRLLKLLLKYAGGCPIRSYFIELFVLRWIEGSHDLPARTIEEILSRMNALGRSPYQHTGPLTRDVVLVVAALSAQMRTCLAEGRILDTVDLTTPETQGRTDACQSMGDMAACVDGFGRIHAAIGRARREEEAGDAEAAIALWRGLLTSGPAGPAEGR